MRRGIRQALVLGLLCALATALTIGGCGGKGAPTSPSNSIPSVIPFYTHAQHVAPVFSPSAHPQSVYRIHPMTVSSGWDIGNPVKRLYDLLRRFDHATDEGVVDDHNMYKVLFETGLLFYGAENDTADRTFDPTSISPTFDFGTTPRTYTHGGTAIYSNSTMGTTYHRSWAFQADSGKTHALFTWIIESTNSQLGYGALEATLDDSTDAIEINLATHVFYADTSWFSLRTWISGNTSTHRFRIKSLDLGRSPLGTTYTSFAGAGVSSGADEYFLFKSHMKYCAGDGDFSFYKIAASANEDSLIAMHGVGLPSGFDGSNDPNGYAADVPETMFIDTDAPSSAGDFSNGNMLQLPAPR